jgi:rhodanese-related sulfurtransferase
MSALNVFGFMKGPDINQGVYEYLRSEGAVLLDVRTPCEYQGAHVPGSVNLPLQSIDSAENILQNKDAPLFVYCHSGARSRQAVQFLKHMGFQNVKNIGGIITYAGTLEA